MEALRHAGSGRFGSSTQAPVSDGEETMRKGRRLHEPEAVGDGGRRAHRSTALPGEVRPGIVR